jgi:hypothetical protein
MKIKNKNQKNTLLYSNKSKLFSNNKGFSAPLYLSLFLIISFTYVVFNVGDFTADFSIGEKHYSILQTNEQVQSLGLYLKNSLTFSLKKTKDIFQTDINSVVRYSECGEHVDLIFKDENQKCVPDYQEAFKSLTKNYFNTYYSTYELAKFSKFNYDFVLKNELNNYNKKMIFLNIVTKENSPIQVPIQDYASIKKREEIQNYNIGYTQVTSEQLGLQKLFRGIKPQQIYNAHPDLLNFLLCMNENFKPISSEGRWINSISDDDLYPGDSNGQECELGKTTIFSNDDYCVHKQDSCHYYPYKYISTITNQQVQSVAVDVPSFKDTELDSFRKALNICNKLTPLRDDWGTGQLYLEEGWDINGKPDHYHLELKKCNVNPKEITSNPTQTTTVNNPTTSTTILNTDESSNLETITSEKTSCNLVGFNPEYVDDYIGGYNRKSVFEHKELFDKYDTQFNIPETKKINYLITKYANEYDVSEELIRAILISEGHFDFYVKEFINGGKKSEYCNYAGFCGIMAMGVEACSDVKKEFGECDFQRIKSNKYEDITYGLEMGVKFIKLNLDNYGFCHKVLVSGTTDVYYTDYYLFARGYNAGTGNCRNSRINAYIQLHPESKISDFSNNKNNDLLHTVSWKDITNEKLKKDGYINWVTYALKDQCGENYNNNFEPPQINYLDYYPRLYSEIDFDLSSYLVVDSFIEYIQTNCLNKNNELCINEAIKQFSNNQRMFFYNDVYSKYEISNKFWRNASNIKNDEIYDLFKISNVNVENNKNIFTSLKMNDVEYYDSFRDSIVDQIINCYDNGQENCVCPIYLEYSLLDDDIEAITSLLNLKSVFSFSQNSERKYTSVNSYYLGEELRGSRALTIPFNTLSYIDGNKENKVDFTKLNFIFEKRNDLVDVSMEFIDDSIINDKNKEIKSVKWRFDSKNPPMSLYKLSKENVSWYYNNKSSNTLSICSNSKQFHRFGLKIGEEDALRFSIYINDSLPPKLDKMNYFETVSLNSMCINNAFYISWDMPITDEPIYAFKIFIDSSSDYETLPLNKIVYMNKEKILKEGMLNILYFDNSTEENKFYYLTESIGSKELQLGNTYSISIAGVDSNGNSNLYSDTYKSSQLSFLKDAQKEEKLNALIKPIIGEATATQMDWGKLICSNVNLPLDISSQTLSQLQTAMMGDEYRCCYTFKPTEIFNKVEVLE